jgi:hypothetical protein
MAGELTGAHPRSIVAVFYIVIIIDIRIFGSLFLTLSRLTVGWIYFGSQAFMILPG